MNYVYFESLCKQKQTTPTAVLETLGLSKGNLNSWRRGGNPSVDVAIKICEQLNCTLDDLIDIKKTAAPDGEQPGNIAVSGLIKEIQDLSWEEAAKVLEYAQLLKLKRNQQPQPPHQE